jgi:hypothetical protein
LAGWRSTRVRAFGVVAVVALALLASLALRNSPPATVLGSPTPAASGVAVGTHGPTTPAATSPTSTRPAPSSAPPTEWGSTFVSSQLRDIAITGRGYVVVGDDRRGGVVWSSINGRDWQVDDDSLIFDRVHLAAIAANSHLTAIVGCDEPAGACTGPAAWIWSGAWHRVAGNPFGATTLLDVAATSDAIVILGASANGSSRLWSSTDGKTWTAMPLPVQTGDKIAGVAADGNRLLAVGRGANLAAVAWVTTDRATWARHELATKATALTAVGFHGTFVVGGGLVTQEASGPDDPESDDPAVWTSTDGARWTSVNLLTDNNGAISLVGATSRGDVAARIGCCNGYFIPPTGPAMQIDGGPSGVSAIVEGPQGFIGTGTSGFSTSPAIAMATPGEPVPVPEMGGGWQTTGTLPIPTALTAASDAVGIAYVFSAASTPGSLRVDRFDGAKWLRLPDLDGGISGAKAVMGTKGLIYLIGVTADGRTGRTIEYNPKAHTWRLRAAMPTARTSFGIAAPGNGSIYVLGGRVSPCCDGVHGDGGLAIVERFDPATNTWHRVHSMPVAEASPGAVAASAPLQSGSGAVTAPPSGTNPIVYVFLAARAWAYDPAADTWTAGPANPSFGMTGSPVVGVDGIVRVFNCDRYDLYDPFNTHWQTGQFFPSASCGVLAVAGTGGNVFVFGGDYLPSPGRSVLAFYAGGG